MRKLRQIWLQLRQDPVLSIVSIVATALSIFLMMVVVSIVRVKTADIYPEVNRSRSLYVSHLSIRSLDGRASMLGRMSREGANNMFGNINGCESLALYSGYLPTKLAYTPEVSYKSLKVKETNDGFWDVFKFKFTEGCPYGEASVLAGEHIAVIDADVASTFFGGETAVGKELFIDDVPYKVCGVVVPCSSATSDAYANIWTPLSPDVGGMSRMNGMDVSHISGNLAVTILADKNVGLQTVRQNAQAAMDAENRKSKELGFEINHFERPYDRYDHAYEQSGFSYHDSKEDLTEIGIILLVLLLVPAINLSGMTTSRLKRRNEEIAIMRAFGHTKGSLIVNIVIENFILTLIAGLVGCALSFAFVHLAAAELFSDGLSKFSGALRIQDIISPGAMLVAVALCFMLNLLSTLVPAVNAVRHNISETIGGNNR